MSCSLGLSRGRVRGILFCSWASALGWAAGCNAPHGAHWLKNGLLDPTQVGNFGGTVSNEIRESISILEEPVGIQDAEEPTSNDLQPLLVEAPLGPGDTINVSIYELLQPGLTSVVQLRLGASGFETLPVMGRVRMAGFTPRELEMELKEQLREAEILPDADVQVSVLMSQAQQFSVLGNVARPGAYPLARPDLRLLDAVALAGGIPPQIERIYIFRREARPERLVPATEAEPVETKQPTLEKEPAAGGVMPLMLSDAASGAGGKSRQPPSQTTAPATTEEAIDELEVLEEREPEGEATMPRWDAERGEWVIDEPGASPPPPGAAETMPAEAAATGIVPIEEAEEQPETQPEGAETQPEQPSTLPQEGAAWEPTPELGPPLRIIEIPVKQLNDGDPRYNICLRSQDLVNVPLDSVGEFYLGGNVLRPGAYSLTGRRLTVKQAIISAGGFGPLAWPARAELVRRVSKDEEQIIQLDLDAIFAGGAPDFYVKPNDIVNIGSTPVSTFMAVLRNAFRFSYGMAFVYDRNFADSDSFQAREQIKTRRRIEAQQRGIPF